MILELDEQDVEQLRVELDDSVRELSHEIADTDNPAYRKVLRLRRDRLQGIRSRLGE